MNRFEGDKPTLHLISTLCNLVEQRQAQYTFLVNGGIACASKVCSLSAEELARNARAAPQCGIKALAYNKNVSQVVRDALQYLQASTAHVPGTDGHRQHCRHEGHAYMTLFGPPLIFTTPNLADGKQPLLLVAQSHEIRLDAADGLSDGVLPNYRDMLRRLA